jgi:preprotein translocase subunit SecF
MAIGCYSIAGYWWLFYWWLLVVILLVVIGYSINDY